MVNKQSRRNPFRSRKEATRRMRLAGVENAEWESRAILEEVLELSPGDPFPEEDLTKEQWKKWTELVRRRCQREPLQYLFGTWEFYGLPFAVGTGVLIPRQDTEALVDTVLELQKDQASTKLLDLCSGSGCIAAAISQHLPNVTGDCVEFSEAAMPYLRKNLEQLAPQLHIWQRDALEMQKELENRQYDVITCNPPYLTEADMRLLQPEVRFEPGEALYGGVDGLQYYKGITRVWKRCLKEDGWLVYEIGMGQAVQVVQILERNGFYNCRVKADLAGVNRVVMGQLKMRYWE